MDTEPGKRPLANNSVPAMTQLPNEILLSILEHLEQHDLLSLSRTCSALSSLATFALYRNVILTHIWGPRCNATLTLFLRAILAEPTLARRVESLTFLEDGESVSAHQMCSRRILETRGSYNKGWQGEDDSEDTSIFTNNELRLLKSEIEGLSVAQSTKTLWYSELNCVNVDLCMILTILKCSALKTLNIVSAFLYSSISQQAMKTLIPKNLAATLQNISLSPDVLSKSDVGLSKVAYPYFTDLLRMPRIQTISVPLPEDASVWSPPLPSSNISKLLLHHCQVSEESLGHVLQATPYLKYLQFDSFYPPAFGPRPWLPRIDTFNCIKLERSLTYVQQTLEVLDLSVLFSRYGMSSERSGWLRSVGHVSLQSFTRVKILKMPYVILLGRFPNDTDGASVPYRQRLPPNLAHLTLTDEPFNVDTSDWSANALLLVLGKHILPTLSRNSTNLRPSSLKLLMQYTQAEQTAVVFENLALLCNEAGVALHTKYKNDEAECGCQACKSAREQRSR